MIRTFTNSEHRFVLSGETLEHLDTAVWVDILRPSKDEETAIERALGIDVPTIEEMSEIEVSSRLYTEEGATFMTTMMLSHTDGDNVLLSPITFILKGEQLITVRYAEPRSIDAFIARCQKGATYTADGVVAGLLDGLIERIGDVLERTGHELDALSDNIFAIKAPLVDGAVAEKVSKRNKARPRNYQSVLEQIGRKGDLLSKVRESLISFQRLLAFGTEIAVSRKPGKEYEGRLRTLTRDVQSLSDHTSFLTQKINFLLDATLGMINIEQTGIIKIFSVAAVVFLPPTLIASIYGMNFEVMPELSWPVGYPLALCLMVLSAVVPYQFFKWRGWL
ncbi:magnesium and cobalt transport protein CorA [Hyphomonas neptunium ATCC 15444]|uniref:Magnesium transport protein CorA n=2 Tax=Hyphomonas TaxID=85 RepID=Q0BYH7_HYPNA|nr:MULTISPECIES: magnesium transporter CorA family protein [Hyphomonas]ABI78672.1 magnesium and cobalt transport protein CorA [Hyphomonas neptunium ATCC 15444]KCZ87062.1 magnesium and cobalt transport protein CorA [Hyphomonas hirschiana VP5]